MRMRTLLVALSLCGCAPLGAEVPTEAEAAPGVHLRVFDSEAGPRLQLVNGGDGPLVLGCEEGGCEVPLLRQEAQQADGSWVERATWTRSHAVVTEPVRLATGEALELTGGPADLDDFTRQMILEQDFEVVPGIYRAVASVSTSTGEPVEVALEYAVVGWSLDDLADAEAIRAAAVTHECAPLLRDLDQTLRERLEPDAMIALHQARADDERLAVQDAMLRGGGFVAYLSHHLTFATLDEVTAAGRFLTRSAPDVQQPLRAVVAARLLDHLDDAAMGVMDFHYLEQLSSDWPDGAGLRLVRALEREPVGDTSWLAGLVGVFAYAERDRFDGLEPRVRAALDLRCRDTRGARETAPGSDEAELDQVCEAATLRFTPGFHGGFGRGFGGSRCGGFVRFQTSSQCRTLSDRFEALRARAGERELTWLDAAW